MSVRVGKLKTSIPIRRLRVRVGQAAAIKPINISLISGIDIVIHLRVQLCEQPILQLQVLQETLYFGCSRKLFVEFGCVPHAQIGPIAQKHQRANQKCKHSTTDPTGDTKYQSTEQFPIAL